MSRYSDEQRRYGLQWKNVYQGSLQSQRQTHIKETSPEIARSRNSRPCGSSKSQSAAENQG